MIDQAKIEATRTAIRELASEYDANGMPDVGNTLRQIAALAPKSLIRLREITKAGVDPR